MAKNKKFAKTLALILLSAVMALAGAFAAFADDPYVGNSTGWQRTSDGGWRYIKMDGLMAADEWVWIGEEATGFHCYFFDGSGNLVVNSITTDGYRVNESGAWVENGVPVTRMLFDNTRSPFGYEVMYGNATAPVTLSQHFTNLIDVRGTADNFPNRKYIRTMDNGDVLFYTTDNDTQIKIQTDGDMVTAIVSPADLMFLDFPKNGIELNALYDNMRYYLASAVPVDTGDSEGDLASYFSMDPYTFASSGMIVMTDRSYDVVICPTLGTDGRYYVYPDSQVMMKLHIDFNPAQVLGPGVQ